MKQLMLTLSSFLLFSSIALAREVKVATIKSDIDRDVTEFFLEVKDDGTLDSMRFITRASNGAIKDDQTHPSERVMEDGIILNQNGNYKVIVLRVAKTFTVDKGGEVILDYLYNGATGVRRVYKFKLDKADDVNFVLRQQNNTPINGFFIYGNRTIFGLVGVKYIEALGG